jgi:alpha-tubulin suppressor-like RCC1 family protein
MFASSSARHSALVGLLVLYVCAVVPCSVSADPESIADLLGELSALDTSELGAIAAEQGATTEEMSFVSAVVEEARASGETRLTKKVLAAAFTREVAKPRVSAEEAAQLVVAELRKPRGGDVQALFSSAVLVPYLMESGLCQGDLGTAQGLVCAYASPASAAEVAGTFSDPGRGLDLALAAPAKGTSLYNILTRVAQLCSQSVTASYSPSVRVENCYQIASSEARLVVVRLDPVEFEAYYAKLLAEPIPPTSPKNILFRVIVAGLSELIPIEIYGEAYTVANIRYGLYDSDSALLVYPYGFTCRVYECEQIASCAAQPGSDPVGCVTSSSGSLGTGWELRPSGGEIRHSISTCDALPIPADARLPFVAVQNDQYALPYGIKFQTRYQEPPRDDVMRAISDASALSLYPRPTQLDRPLSTAETLGLSSVSAADPQWTYSFSRIAAYDYNLVFSGLQTKETAGPTTSSAPELCKRSRYWAGRSIYGDAFWRYHGRGHGDARTCNQYPFDLDDDCPDYVARADDIFPMPVTDLVWAQTLAHQAMPPSCAINAPATVSVVGSASAAEGSPVVFQIARIGNKDFDVLVNYSTASGTATAGVDFVPTSGSVTIRAGEDAATVSVPTIPDSGDGPGSVEAFALNIFTPTVDAVVGAGTAEGVIAERLGKAQVSAGGSHSCATNSDASLWCWGRTYSGLDGISENAPVRFGDVDWKSVASGMNGSCAVKYNGTLWCLGLPQATAQYDYDIPTQIGTATDWDTVTAGAYHNCAIKRNGSLWCWGVNSFGQLGNGTSNGTITGIPARVGSGTDWMQVSGGNHHTCGLKKNGTIWCWGNNADLQLTGLAGTFLLPTQVGTDADWAEVAAAHSTSCARKTNGTVWCWGSDAGDGALGDGPTNTSGPPRSVSSLRTWTGVGASFNRGCAVDSLSLLYCWGDNRYGALGDGTTSDRTSPTLISGHSNWAAVDPGWEHTCATKKDNTIWCWGNNGLGRLGGGPNTGASSSRPIQVRLGP